MTEIEHNGTVAMTAPDQISSELLGKIVDEVFDGAIEDASVIEEIYAAIKRHETPAPVHHAGGIKALDLAPGPYRVCDDDGWVVRAADGSNVMGSGFRWNSRSVARCFKDEYQLLGHKGTSPPIPNAEGDNQPRYTTKRLQDEIAKARAYGLKMAAELIEDNAILHTAAGKVLRPRQEGNQDGLYYATAIRALTASEGSTDA